MILTQVFLIVFGAICAFYVLHFIFTVRNNKKFDNTPKNILRITAPQDNEKTPAVAESIFSTLHNAVETEGFINWFLGIKSPRFSFEIATNNQKIYFYIWCPKDYKDQIKSQVYAQYPGTEIEEVDDYIKEEESVVCAELKTTDPYIYPIKRHPEFIDKSTQEFNDPISAITASFSVLSNQENIYTQIVFSPLDQNWRHRGNYIAKKISGGFSINSPNYKIWFTNMLLERRLRRFFYLPLRFLLTIFGLSAKIKNEKLKEKEEVEKSHDRESKEQAIEGKLSQSGFNVNIRLVCTSENSQRAQNILKNTLSTFYQFNIPRFNSFGVRVFNKHNKAIFKRYQKREIIKPFILNTEELATIWHLPNITVKTPNIQWVDSKKMEAPLNLPTEESAIKEDYTAIGKTNFRGNGRFFGVKGVDRRRHIYILGKTGMGKSTILENMIFSDIQNGKGVAIVDPHGDLAEAVINFIPKNRTNDVVIFDPSDTNFPISFNMLECKNPEQRNLIASGLIGVFKKMFGDSWGPRLEHILRNTLITLTFAENATMLGILRILSDEKYRQQILKKVTDPVILDFWKNEFGKWQPRQVAENISPIQNKVGQFLSSPIIRNILGQPKSTIDIRFAMDKKKIIIVNLSKGKIGEDSSALLGSMLITKFQLDAMSRANIPEKERIDFYLYVDEFQNFATESFATILSEARKYKLNLTMANQYIAQMPEEVCDAVFGNVGSIISCQVGADDAEYLSKQFSEEVLPKDIVNLPKFKSYIRLMVDGMPSKVFSMDNLPPPEFEDDLQKRENIIKVSRDRYAKPRDIVEDKIMRWSKNTK